MYAKFATSPFAHWVSSTDSHAPWNTSTHLTLVLGPGLSSPWILLWDLVSTTTTHKEDSTAFLEIGWFSPLLQTLRRPYAGDCHFSSLPSLESRRVIHDVIFLCRQVNSDINYSPELLERLNFRVTAARTKYTASSAYIANSTLLRPQRYGNILPYNPEYLYCTNSSFKRNLQVLSLQNQLTFVWHHPNYFAGAFKSHIRCFQCNAATITFEQGDSVYISADFVTIVIVMLMLLLEHIILLLLLLLYYNIIVVIMAFAVFMVMI